MNATAQTDKRSASVTLRLITGEEGECTQLPPWSDVGSLLAEIAWLRTWTRHLEEQNARLRGRCRYCQ